MCFFVDRGKIIARGQQVGGVDCTLKQLLEVSCVIVQSICVCNFNKLLMTDAHACNGVSPHLLRAHSSGLDQVLACLHSIKE